MNKIHIYNTLTRQKELFKPVKEGFAGVYVCGPTVYGDAHLGHAKSYVSFDVVIRYLRYTGLRVRYVQNITDVGHLTDDADQGEDKLAKQARIEQLEPMEIAEKYTNSYFRDMDALNVERPDITPRASGHIPEQIALVEQLIKEGNAYEVNGNVYFDVSSDPEYGKLSGRTIDESISGTRVDTASDKKNPEDFALWKKAGEEHLMKWASPWGEGYPGWHVECSAMSTKYLGKTFDIHGGGLENQFPHHECEIAQSECANHEPFARYWMHNNMVTLEGQKMGKSLGNAISLYQFFDGSHRLLSRAWKPEIIRFFLLQSHYRSTTDFSESALEAAESGLKNLFTITREIMNAEPNDSAAPYNVDSLKDDFEQQMNDDFNSAKAIAVLFDHGKGLRKLIRNNEIPSNIDAVQELWKSLMHNVIGLWPDAGQDQGSEKAEALDGAMELLIELRADARKNKNFDQADQIRDRLKEVGITLEDGADGTTYSLKN